MQTMEEETTWTDIFFSGNRPELVEAQETNSENKSRFFHPDDENWILGELADKSRPVNDKSIQVFWLWSNGCKKHIGKVFPVYANEQAREQLHRLGVPRLYIPPMIDDAMHGFDRFYREARAYSHIDRFCSTQERIYFPNFSGVATDMQRSRFSSGYAHPRAIILETIKPNIYSRRVLGEDTSQLPGSFSDILANLPISPFEREWYYSLLKDLKDRLRRLDALHRTRVTHGDVKDCHFRLPGDIYDTVLYDFSESYTFSEKLPLRVNSGKPRPLERISKGERERVKIQIEQRAIARDLRPHHVELSSQSTVDDALWQSLDNEEELMELVILKVFNRPDYFAMPTLNSIFSFLEAVRPESDPCWHIRRGRLLHQYVPVWAICNDKASSIKLSFMMMKQQFKTVEICDTSQIMLCLVPKWWNLSSRAIHDPSSKNTGFKQKLQEVCRLLVSPRCPGYVLGHDEVLGTDKKERDDNIG